VGEARPTKLNMNNIIIPQPGYDREELAEFRTEDQNVYLVMNAETVYRDRDPERAIVVSFERERGYLNFKIFEVVLDRNKIPEGESEDDIRVKMREFGLAQLRKVIATGTNPENVTSPEGYVFQSLSFGYRYISAIDNEFRTRLSRLLDNTTSSKLTRTANKLFPSQESQIITVTLECFCFVLESIKSDDPPRFSPVFSRTDVPKYLDILDGLLSRLNEARGDTISDDNLKDVLDIINEVDLFHVKYHVRKPEINAPVLHVEKVKESLSILDRLHEKKAQLDEVLASLKSFSESKDQARKDILGNISEIFDRRMEKISTRPWLFAGTSFAAISILYLFIVWTGFKIPYFKDSAWFSPLSGDAWGGIIMRLAVFSVFSYLTFFCFRRYVYERKAKEIYAFKQTALNAMGSLLEIHKGNENQTNQIMTHALPHIFNETSVNLEKQNPQDVNQTMLLEVIKSLGKSQ